MPIRAAHPPNALLPCRRKKGEEEGGGGVGRCSEPEIKKPAPEKQPNKKQKRGGLLAQSGFSCSERCRVGVCRRAPLLPRQIRFRDCEVAEETRCQDNPMGSQSS